MIDEEKARAQRREPRYPSRIRVVLLLGSKELPVFTEDISMQGLRVRTDQALPKRQLLRLKVPVGEQGEEVICQGMAVHSAPSEVDGTPSVGIQFYALDSAVRDAWGQVVAKHRSAAAVVVAGPSETTPRPRTTTPPPPVASVRPRAIRPPPTPLAARVAPVTAAAPMAAIAPIEEPIRRQWPRKAARVTVYIGSMDDLITFTTVNVSRGGMFLAASQPLAIGERLRLEMKSPDTHPFSVEAVVRRVDLTSDPPGMGVEFIESTNAEKIDALFENEGLEEEEPVFVTSFDPNLE